MPVTGRTEESGILGWDVKYVLLKPSLLRSLYSTVRWRWITSPLASRGAMRAVKYRLKFNGAISLQAVEALS
jgi:hypothetical protein